VTLLKLVSAEAKEMLESLLTIVDPVSEFIDVVIEVVKSQKFVACAGIKTLHELNIDNSGVKNVDIWLS
jgi:hypothetical protein